MAGVVFAAVGGAFSWTLGHINVWGVVGLAGFAAALLAELVLLLQRPERDWYSSRAIAESTKTLAWKYAVQGEPFGRTLNDDDARALLAERLKEVAEKVNGHVTVPAGSDAIVTDAMTHLRRAPISRRREAYLRGRLIDQQRWYARKAELNQRRSITWMLGLVGGEIGAVIVAAGRAFGGWQVDWSSILAALVASGAAWLGLKQHTALAAAYRVATTELALIVDRVKTATEQNWAQAVADAEEAISREHTMWLASRSDRSP